MRKAIYRILLSIFALALFTTCSKDINILANYEDTTIVYGLINPNDSISYLRIQKGFLTEGNIYDAAQVHDSIYYPYKLNVKLTSGSRIITFDTITLFNKEGGIFNSPKTQVYYANTKGLLNTEDSIYLEIYNPKLNKLTTSSSILHNTMNIDYLYPHYQISFEENKVIKFLSQKNTRSYALTIRFHYMEQNVNDTSTREYLYVDWDFSNIITEDILGGEEIQFHYNGAEFYSYLLNNIPETITKQRYYGNIELRLSSYDNIFHIYQEANKPNGSPLIEKPGYTNINNGLGLFAARSKGYKFYNMNIYTKAHVKRLPELNFVDGMPEDGR